jgi:hypothetical protein
MQLLFSHPLVSDLSIDLRRGFGGIQLVLLQGAQPIQLLLLSVAQRGQSGVQAGHPHVANRLERAQGRR